jgi:hypothetical protein
MIRRKLLIGALSMAFAGGAFAQAAKTDAKAAPKDDWMARFKKADANNSGGLSKAELEKTGPNEFGFIKRNFDQLDTNKDGQVTIAERDAGLKAAQAKDAKQPVKK